MAEEKVDQGKRKFLLSLTSLFGAFGAVFVSVPFLSSWLPSAKAKAAGAPVQVDISRLQPDQRLVVEWRGKPVWVIRRSQEDLDRLESIPSLRDPNSSVEQQPAYAKNLFRSVNPEYLVLVGVCTHLGCSPTFVPGIGKLGPNWPGGFYCPCHGSKFDLAGRVFTGVPAPINLEVPPYKFLNDTTIMIGVDTETGAA